MTLRQLRWCVVAMLFSMASWGGSVVAQPSKLYVADEEGDMVTVVSGVSFAPLASIPVGRGPNGISVTP